MVSPEEKGMQTGLGGGVIALKRIDEDHVEICNPTDAILAAEKNVGDDDPAFCFGWNVDQLNAAVDWANTVGNQPTLPAWYTAGAYPITARNIQDGLATILANCGSGTLHGNVLLAPNSLAEYSRIQQKMQQLMMRDAFLRAVCTGAGRCPLARVYVLADGKRPAVGEHMPMLPLPPGLGVQVFEQLKDRNTGRRV